MGREVNALRSKLRSGGAPARGSAGGLFSKVSSCCSRGPSVRA